MAYQQHWRVHWKGVSEHRIVSGQGTGAEVAEAFTPTGDMTFTSPAAAHEYAKSLMEDDAIVEAWVVGPIYIRSIHG